MRLPACESDGELSIESFDAVEKKWIVVCFFAYFRCADRRFHEPTGYEIMHRGRCGGVQNWPSHSSCSPKLNADSLL